MRNIADRFSELRVEEQQSNLLQRSLIYKLSEINIRARSAIQRALINFPELNARPQRRAYPSDKGQSDAKVGGSERDDIN